MTAFNTSAFEFAHGRKPSGRGSWAFSFRRDADISEYFFTPSNMTYAEAKKEAAKEAARRNVSTVYVGS